MFTENKLTGKVVDGDRLFVEFIPHFKNYGLGCNYILRASDYYKYDIRYIKGDQIISTRTMKVKDYILDDFLSFIFWDVNPFVAEMFMQPYWLDSDRLHQFTYVEIKKLKPNVDLEFRYKDNDTLICIEDVPLEKIRNHKTYYSIYEL